MAADDPRKEGLYTRGFEHADKARGAIGSDRTIEVHRVLAGRPRRSLASPHSLPSPARFLKLFLLGSLAGQVSKQVLL